MRIWKRTKRTSKKHWKPVVDDLQAHGTVEDEEILEAFESYAEVRRKMAEKKKS